MDALFAAVRLGDAAKLAHLLEKESAFVNSPSQNGEFALHVAARVMGPGAVECIEVLVKHNAKVNARDSKGRTPLHHAAAFGRISSLMTLVRKGGRLDVFDVSAHTPIDVALRACGSSIKKSDLENQIVEVHTWGKAANLALGHGDMYNRAAPKKVVRLAGLDINNTKNGICCSKNHTVVCTTKGDVYTWGIGTGGRLGYGDETHYLAPVMLSLNKVIVVACSISHSGFITSEGRIYMCGANEFGQLGQGNTEPSFSPKRIRWREDPGDPMVSLSLSPSHSVALTSKGQVWTWGRDNEGQLGIGPSQKPLQTEPKLVPLFAGTISLSSSAPLFALHIAAGQGCTVIGTSVHDIAVFGFNRPLTRFVLEHPRSYISKVSVSGSGVRGVAVTEAGQVFTWQPPNDPPSPSRIVFPLSIPPLSLPSSTALPTSSSSSSTPSASAFSQPRFIVRNAVTTDAHIMLSTDSGSVYYYEYPPPAALSNPSTPPPTLSTSSASSSVLRRMPIQRAVSVATSDTHSVVAARACVPAVLLDVGPSTFSADFSALSASMLFSDMSFVTNDGQIIPGHRVIVSRVPHFNYIEYASTIPINAPHTVATSFLSLLYSCPPSNLSFVAPEVGVLLEEFKSESWVPLQLHLSHHLSHGLYSDMSVITTNEDHLENSTTTTTTTTSSSTTTTSSSSSSSSNRTSHALHRVVMAARCDYFLAMSTSGMREAMPLPFEENGEEQWGEGEGSKLTTSLEISSSLFQPIVNFIYTDDINAQPPTTKGKSKEKHSNTSTTTSSSSVLSVGFWLELLAAADQFMISQLKTIAANNVLPHVRVDSVGSIISLAMDIDPFDTRLQDSCLGYIRDNLDIMLAARALEDMSAHVLALIDDKLNPLSEDEIAIQNAAKSKRKAKGVDTSFQSGSLDESCLPSPSASPSSLPSPSPSSFNKLGHPGETPPTSKTMQKKMKQEAKEQKEQKQQKEQKDQNEARKQQKEEQTKQLSETPPVLLVSPISKIMPFQNSPISQISQNSPQQEQQQVPAEEKEKKKKKQTMKRIVGFDPVLIAQALGEGENTKRASPAPSLPSSEPPKLAWSLDTKAPVNQPISLLQIQKQQVMQHSPLGHSPAKSTKASFSSSVSLDQFLGSQEKKEKDKDKEPEKPFSWGASAREVPDPSPSTTSHLPPKPKIDLLALAAEEQAAKNKRKEKAKPPPPLAPLPLPPPPQSTSFPSQPIPSLPKPKMDLAAYINEQQTEKDKRIKMLNLPPKPIAVIEAEERALQITRMFEAASTPPPPPPSSSPAPSSSHPPKNGKNNRPSGKSGKNGPNGKGGKSGPSGKSGKNGPSDKNGSSGRNERGGRSEKRGKSDKSDMGEKSGDQRPSPRRTNTPRAEVVSTPSVVETKPPSDVEAKKTTT